jgi:transcriptional regulator with XRE-family HTH domain
LAADLAEKLGFALKALSLSRIQLAAELGVDKSVVGRWVTGAVAPSAHNLAKLTALVSQRSPGFSVLDWEKDLPDLAIALGVKAKNPQINGEHVFGDGLPLNLLDHSAATTRMRGPAYEGFFRSLRPYAQHPGKFIRDHIMVRREPNGLLSFAMLSGGVEVEGWVMLLQNQVFCIGSEMTSGSLVFAIFNGVSTLQAGRLDGIILSCALDTTRTPTATAVVIDRIGDLTGDEVCDRACLEDLAAPEPVADDDQLDPVLVSHLLRDIGPAELARGGDLLLRMPLVRSLSRGLLPEA